MGVDKRNFQQRQLQNISGYRHRNLMVWSIVKHVSSVTVYFTLYKFQSWDRFQTVAPQIDPRDEILERNGVMVRLTCVPCNSLQWRRNGRDGVSNHKPHDCLRNRLFRCKSKKTSKLRITGIYAGNPTGTSEFPTQMASNAEMFPFDGVIMFLCVFWYYDILIRIML